MPKMRSLNNTRQVQSDYLKRVERLCGEEMAEEINHKINCHLINIVRLPKEVLKSHYRSLASGINKPVKYINKATL
jgi:hypothetical protein